MNAVWEVLIQAMRSDRPQTDIQYLQTRTHSPYMEVVLNDLNFRELQTTGRQSAIEVEVNPYRRFTDVFECLTNGSLEEEHRQLNDVLFDISMHYIANLELYEGLNRLEYYRLFLRDEIKAGLFGGKYADVLDSFLYDDARNVETAIAILYRCGPSFHLLRSIFRTLFQHSALYLEKGKKEELLVYIGKKRTVQLERQVEFLISVFAPVEYIVHLFWDKHFGMIGVDQMMEIGEFEVF